MGGEGKSEDENWVAKGSEKDNVGLSADFTWLGLARNLHRHHPRVRWDCWMEVEKEEGGVSHGII